MSDMEVLKLKSKNPSDAAKSLETEIEQIKKQADINRKKTQRRFREAYMTDTDDLKLLKKIKVLQDK
jgi:hypothetical protein